MHAPLSDTLSCNNRVLSNTKLMTLAVSIILIHLLSLKTHSCYNKKCQGGMSSTYLH